MQVQSVEPKLPRSLRPPLLPLLPGDLNWEGHPSCRQRLDHFRQVEDARDHHRPLALPLLCLMRRRTRKGREQLEGSV